MQIVISVKITLCKMGKICIKCSPFVYSQGPQPILSRFSRFFQGFQGHFMVFFKVPGDEIQGFSRSFRESNKNLDFSMVN